LAVFLFEIDIGRHFSDHFFCFYETDFSDYNSRRSSEPKPPASHEYKHSLESLPNLIEEVIRQIHDAAGWGNSYVQQVLLPGIWFYFW
jgi:hypothetical protein